ncbi:uncharacterized protein BO88DRAFT_471307 [Aspergillus vadensis CBS 113365]|uniref:Uncharacterized protein n=1 Tax=Aspergillus vadensis (strain CBS 113365 / IMI 142717 / IBT 24658) TaxID=1448311 RepID=A0A319AYH0_ASPVC|nr:hypothetical protein BO88DRAFT_471307 [Aspergillus vadensis CBS 113365]PYH65436.1 hypothetical protein BO88DRAFT_471307 [Aspergillus vadensis CBS 113365]
MKTGRAGRRSIRVPSFPKVPNRRAMTGQWVYFRVELNSDSAGVRPPERSSSDHPQEVNAPTVYGCRFAEKKKTGGWDAQGGQADKTVRETRNATQLRLLYSGK